MPSIVKEDHDALNATLTVTVGKDDYKGKFEEQLARYRKQASLKGFRKGKTPKSVVRKMFGRSILSEAVNEVLQREMSEYLYNGEVNILGQPLPSDTQESIDFDHIELRDFEFKFDIALAPEFELQGMDEGHSFEKLKVTPGDEKLAEELMNLRRRFGQSEEVDAAVEEEDIITAFAQELDGGAAKEGGVENEFTLFVRNADEAVKQDLLGKKVGDTVQVDIFSVEPNNSEEHVRKYLLGLEESDEREVSPTFSLEIRKVSRFSPAEMNEEFYKQAFGEGDVSSEEEALAKIADDYGKYYENQADALLFRDFQEYLMEQNPLELPDAFLKRWLVASSDQNSPEVVEAGYEGFAKNLQWTLVRQKLVDRFEVEVEPSAVREAFADQVRGYFGQANPEWMNDEMLGGMVDRLMQDESQVEKKYDELVTDRVHVQLKTFFNLTDKLITPEDLETLVEEARAKVEAETALAKAVEEEE